MAVTMVCISVGALPARAQETASALATPRPSLARQLAPPRARVVSGLPVEAVHDAPDSPENFRIAVALATHAPLSVGGSIDLDIARGFFAQFHAGFMPRGYVDLVNDVATQLGFYDPALGTLVSSALSGSLVLRQSVGWRPSESGIEILAGFSTMMAGGSASSRELVEQATGRSLPGVSGEIPVDATALALHVAIGVRWFVFRDWFVRGRIGYTHTVSASANVDVPGREEVSQEAAALVEDTLTRYGFFPELQLETGVRF